MAPEKPTSFGRFERLSQAVQEHQDDYYFLSRKNRAKLMQEIFKEKDHFMANAMRAYEHFEKLVGYTEGMEFEDGKAVILYPASGSHIAPIAAMGEALLKKHGLKEVEFIYTEIAGIPVLTDIKTALEKLAKKNGWSINHEYFQHDYHITVDEETAKNGGAFESVMELDTPYGKIHVRYKNALSGYDYYLDTDLQRSHIVISHDQNFTGNKGIKNFVEEVTSKKQDKENFLVIAEDFTDTTRHGDEAFAVPDNLNMVARIPLPYGCSAAHKKAPKIIIPSQDPREVSLDIGELGLIHPKVLELLVLLDQYGKMSISKKEKKLKCTLSGTSQVWRYHGILFRENTKSHGEKEMGDALFKDFLKYLGVRRLKKDDFHFEVGTDDLLGHTTYFPRSFILPPELFDEKIFNIIQHDEVELQTTPDSTNYDPNTPIWDGSIVIKAN